MDSQQILDLYTWEPGICFRHPSMGELSTAHVVTIRPTAGGMQDVRACRECILHIEADRKASAERQGLPYVPGCPMASEQDDYGP